MAEGITVKFSATDAGFSGTVNKIKQSMNSMDKNARGMSSSVQNSFKSMASVAAGLTGVTAGITALTGATIAAQKVMSEYAEFDSLVRSLKTMDGTAEATASRLERLREVAKLPGIGFEEAVKGDVRLRATGLSAELAEKALRGFGNALASAGGSADDLNGVIRALGQISAKGKVSAEEINQLAERVPQIRKIMESAFGTADTEAIQKMGVSSKEFIAAIVNELEKLPKVTGGAQNVLDNYADSWKALKSQVAEFGVQIAGSWINDVSRAFTQARKDLVSLKELMGMKTPGLEGTDGKTEVARQAEIESEKKLEIERYTANEEAKVFNANTEFWRKKQEERTEFLRTESEKRLEIEKSYKDRVEAAQEDVFASKLTPENNLKRKIANLEAEGPSTAEAVNNAKSLEVKTKIAERIAKIVGLQKELNSLQERGVEQAKEEQKAAKEKYDAQQASRADLDAEMSAIRARRSGQSELAAEIIKENELRKESIALAEAVGMSEKEALQTLRDKVAITEESRLAAGGLELRTEDRAQKRAEARQTKKEDYRLRSKSPDDKKRKEEMVPGQGGKPGGKNPEEAAKAEGNAVLTEIKSLVDAIKTTINKIEPKLPTAALGA